MFPKILTIIGCLLLMLGVIGFIFLQLRPVIDAVKTVSNPDKTQTSHETDKKQATYEARKLLSKACGLSVLSGLFLLAFGLAIQYMPRGNDSIFSSPAEGADIGNNAEQVNALNESLSSNNTNNLLIEIIISEDTIRMNGKTFNSIEDFENELKNIDRSQNISIKDDYAISSVYHQVESLLIKYDLSDKDELE